MKEQIKILVNFQNIEIESARIESELSVVSMKIDALDASLIEFEKEFETEATQLNEIKKQYRQYETDVQMNMSQIEKSQEKLRSVKTNKEYQSILKEIEDIQNKSSLLEDEMIKCLEQMEMVEKTIFSKKDDFLKLKDHVKNEKDAIEREAERNRKRLAELEVESEKIATEIDSELLKKYAIVKEKDLVTGAEGIGTCEEVIDYGEMRNQKRTFSLTKCIRKAERNAKERLIPVPRKALVELVKELMK